MGNSYSWTKHSEPKPVPDPWWGLTGVRQIAGSDCHPHIYKDRALGNYKSE